MIDPMIMAWNELAGYLTPLQHLQKKFLLAFFYVGGPKKQ